MRAEFIAITSDDSLLEQIGQALDGESTVRHVETAPEAREFLRPTQPCVLLLDATELEDPATIVKGLQSPDLTSVVIVFAPANRSADVARAIRGSSAFAVLPIPVEPAQATAVIEGAREECLARYSLAVSQQASAPPTALAPAPAPALAPAPVSATAPAPVSASASASASTTVDAPVSANPARPKAPVPPTPAEFDAQQTFPPLPAGGRSGGGKAKLVMVAGAALAMIAAAVAWLMLGEPEAPPREAAAPVVSVPTSPTAEASAPVEAPAPAVTPEAIQSGSIDELLESARAAIRARRYTSPEGDNALNYYRSVLAQEPDNGEASEGLQRIAGVLQERTQAALAARRTEEAAGTIAQLRSIRPDHPALAQFDAKLADAQIGSALGEGNVERASNLLRSATQAGTLPQQSAARWRSEIERQQGNVQADQLARLVSVKIREGKLVDPANDNAKLYLAQLRRLPHAPPQLVSRATTELQQAYLKQFREASAQAQATESERWQVEARALGVSAAELAAIQRETSSRATAKQVQQDSTNFAQLIQQRIAAGQLLEPSGDSALFHLNAFRKADPTSAALATSERALSAKLLEQGRGALTNGGFYQAQASAAAARQIGVNLDQVAALERDVAAAGSAQPEPQAPSKNAQSPIQLKRTRYVQPDYPADALKNKLAGEVRVRVTVQADGKVKDATVLSSNPAKVFDEAALTAARKWRFKPIGEDDSGVEASAVATIAFQPGGSKP